MKNILILLFLMCFGAAIAQNDPIYYLSDSFLEMPKGNHSYYQVIKNSDKTNIPHDQIMYYATDSVYSKGTFSEKGFPTGIWDFYYPNGNLKEKVYFDRVPAGYYACFYEDGHMQFEGTIIKTSKNIFPENMRIKNYWNPEKKQIVTDGRGTLLVSNEDCVMEGAVKNGVKDSVWYGSSKKHKIDFAEIYKDGELVSGVSVDSTDATHQYKIINVNCQPKGGNKVLNDFLKNNFEIPRTLRGTASTIITFVVGTEGKITSYKIIREDHQGIGEELVNTLKAFPEWIPRTYRGVKMPEAFTVPLTVDNRYGFSFERESQVIDPSRNNLHFANPALSGNRPDYR